MASVGSRVTRLERRGGGLSDEARIALAKLAAGTPLDDITDAELRAMCVVYGYRPPDYTAMSDDELAARIAALHARMATR